MEITQHEDGTITVKARSGNTTVEKTFNCRMKKAITKFKQHSKLYL